MKRKKSVGRRLVRRLGVLCLFAAGALTARGATVVYAAESSAGTGDGSSWANAMAWTDALAANLASDSEIRLTGDVTVSAIPDTLTVSGALRISGGFSGDDADPDARACDDDRSTFTGADAYDLFSFKVTGSLEFENILFTRGAVRAVATSGAGPVTFVNCSLSQNGRTIGHNSGQATGCGLNATGTGVITLKKCQIEGNGPRSYPENSGYGWGVRVSNAAHVYIDECQFVTNGTKLGTQTDVYGGKAYGIAYYAGNAVTTFTSCRFAGNTPRCGQWADCGGVVVLDGNCSGSVFSNCTFVGNQELLGHSAVDGGGIVQIKMKNTSDTVLFTNCVFAYNMAQSRTDATALTVMKGTATVTGSTFYHNLNGWSEARGKGVDIHVRSTGYLTLEKSNLSDLASSVTYATAANVTIDTATITTDTPAFVSTALDMEDLLTYQSGSYPTSVNFKNEGATYAAMSSLSVERIVPAPTKPDLGSGNILYVDYAAADGGQGTGWDDAFNTLEAALAVASAVKNEIWIKGDVTLAADGAWTLVDADVTVRGGFAGTESAASDRAAGARSTIDGGGSYNPVRISVKPGVTVAFEDLVFTCAKNRAVHRRWYGSLAFRNCRFLNNGRTQKNAGRAIYAPNAAGYGTLTITNCAFEGQMYNSAVESPGHGGAVYATNMKGLTIDDTLFASNGMVKANQGTNAGYGLGAALYAYAAPVTMRNTRVAGNCWAMKKNDGGIVYCGGYQNGSSFTNCAFVGNYELRCDSNANSYGGALVLNPSSSTAPIDVKSCTFAFNVSQGSGCASALNVRTGAVTVKDCIFWKNPHGCVSVSTYGSEIECAGGTCSVSHSIVTSTEVAACHGDNLTLDTSTIYTDDPLFVTTNAEFDALYSGSSYLNPTAAWTYEKVANFDVHLRSPGRYYLNDGTVGPTVLDSSPGIDKGDPDAAYANEPSPNGSRINLGAYGNTAKASETPVGQPKVDAFTITYPNDESRPYATLTMGLASGSGYFASVTLTCTVNGSALATKTFVNVRAGDIVTWGAPIYCDVDDEVVFGYTISADDATTITDSKTSVNTCANKPAYCGHGGGATVVHVRTGADCLQTGADWTQAYATLAEALASDLTGKTEVWVMAEAESANGSFTPTASLAIRGGFSGTEDAASERAADTRTVIDYGNAANGFVFANAAGVTLELDRFVIRRATTRAVKKSGAGDLILRDCRLSCNGWDKKNTEGKGLYVSDGGSAATITVTNTVIDGNLDMYTGHGESGGYGAGIYVTGCRRLVVDDSLFVSNGIEVIVNCGSFFGGMRGAALYANATPVTARRCRFTANALGNRGAGGIVALDGNCNGSAFTNCAFVGNFERMDNSGNASSWGGALAINMDATSRTCDIEGCTIAYNVTDSQYAAGGLTVINGNVTVKDSIIWSNFRNKYRSASYAEDIEAKGGTCTVSHSLVTGTGTDKCRGAAAGYLTLDADTVYTDDPTFVSSFDDFLTLYTTNATSVARTSLCTYAALAALDAHLISAERYYLNDGTVGSKAETSSPAIDKGDPTLACVEPAPNGNRVNLGAYGNTPQASATPAGQPSAELALTLPTEYSRPRATLTMGIAKGSDYKAEVTLYCRTGTVELASKTWTGVQNGSVLVWDVPYYFADGTQVTVSYSVTADGADPVSSSGAVTSTGSFPAFYGKGGGANVIHVRAGADCLQTGADWTDAYADLATALTAAVEAGKTEIWISQGTYTLAANVSLDRDLAIRGGFACTENAASERPSGTRATINNGGTLTGLVVANVEDTLLTLDRVNFTWSLNQAVQKTGKGDLMAIDCAFDYNGRSACFAGRAIYMSAGGVGSLGITNCTFRGNQGASRDGSYMSTVYAGNCAVASVDRCTFELNGTWFHAPNVADCWRVHGAAICALNSRLVCTGCRFAANGSGTDNGDGTGGIVYLDGTCGGSVLENCAFVGNYETVSTQRTGGDGGTVVVYLNDKAATATLRNCTFAHNISCSRWAPGGLCVRKGTVTATDCLFWNNRNGYLETEQEIHDAGGDPGAPDDIYVEADGSLTLVNTLIAATNFPSARSAGTLAFEGSVVTNADPLFVTNTATMTALKTVTSTREYYADVNMAAVSLANVHLRGGAGYTDETTGAFVDAWASQDRSPAQDAGTRHPRREPRPTGGRTDLGAYGNSPWTTLPPRSGVSVFAR